MSIDLHVHSNFSDGTESPQEIIDNAADIGLKAISITDHETIESYSNIANYTIETIQGVEVSAKWDKSDEKNPESGVHLLMYFVDAESSLNKLLKTIRKNKEIRNYQIVDKLKKLGMNLDLSLINKREKQVIGRPHIAELLIKKGYVENISEAFIKYLGNGKPAYVDFHQTPIEELMEIAIDSKVVTVLAHPHTLDPRKNMLRNNNWIDGGLSENINLLKSMGLSGVETHYSSYTSSIISSLSELTRSMGLLETGGSDYHGYIKPGLNLGFGWENKPLDVPNKLLDKLKEKYEAIR